MKKFILAITIGLTVVACENDSNNKGTENKDNKSEIAKSNTPLSPCDLLTEDEIRDTYNISDTVFASIVDNKKTYPTCNYKWENLKYTSTMKIGDQDVIIDHNYEMTIVLVENTTDKMFEKSTSIYKEPEMLNDIGDKAIRGTNMSQITLLKNGYMVHLNARMSGDKEYNKQQMIQLAKLVAQKL